MNKEKGSLWGGCFSTSMNDVMEQFNKSIDIDKKLWSCDIKGSVAYARALCKACLVSEEEFSSIESGLLQIRKEWEDGDFHILESDEDIHTAHERRLTELIGSVGGKLHVGRSRNDQVTTDMRLWLRDEIDLIGRLLASTIRALVERADSEKRVIMPGYTHLQRAQPILWSHLLLSYAWMLKRDADRLGDVRKRVDVLTLGSGALAGNPFPIDREQLAKDLEFSAVSQNSLDATSDRDFILEFLFWASLVSSHLSKFAEDFIIYSTAEFGFITLSDSFSTGSSLMPQKKNADSLELVRAKSGRLFGKCAGFMMVSKGLPSTYNKDLQEDKESMFDAADTIENVLKIVRGVVETTKVNEERCRAAITSEMMATDVAYHLVTCHGVTFRRAHEVAGKAVLFASQGNPGGGDGGLAALTLDQWKSIEPRLDERVLKLWNPEASVQQYAATGGTAPSSVDQQISRLREWLGDRVQLL